MHVFDRFSKAPRSAARGGLIAVAMLVATGAAVHAQDGLPSLAGRPASQACAALDGTAIPAHAIGLPSSGATIISSELVVAGAPDNENGEFCKVLGAIHPVSYNAPDINFEVNLPSQWNGRSLQLGGGGFNGSVVTGLGRYAKQPDSEPTCS